MIRNTALVMLENLWVLLGNISYEEVYEENDISQGRA
jgi:hypothetical protein